MNMKPIIPDLMSEALTNREAQEYAARRHLPTRQKQHRIWTVQGSCPWRQWCVAARMPGKALAVWQLIHHRSKMSRQPWVTLPLELLVEVGVSQDAKDRAFQSLERDGLVQVDRRPGRPARIALVTFEADDELPDC